MEWLKKLFEVLFKPMGSASSSFGSGAGEPLNQFSSYLNSKTGGHLTGAQMEANEFSARMAEEEYARQVEFYEKFQSPRAMMNQGINPFTINGSTGSHSASGGAPSSVSPSAPSAPDLLSVVQAVFGMQQQQKLNSSQVQLNSAQARMFSANAQGQENTNSVFGVLHNLSVEEIQGRIDARKQEIAESIQRVQESVSRINVNNSTIELNGSTIKLQGSEAELNASKDAVEHLNAEKLSICMPYIKARQEAEIALINAKTETEFHAAEKMMYDANHSMLYMMVEQEMISQGYYDELIKQNQFETGASDWKTKTIKRNYKWKPVNDVCGNVSKLATSAAAVIGALNPIGGNGAISAAAVTNAPAIGNEIYW